ncbi:ACP S-malonyltransferase [Candidatus Izemoplasma sp. B36]|uniref:ACP S-malonyltransferase n=1 Tax=Candidatus Izemoplasma sp. B36 TaxID=3242468 RepID=UPI003557FF3A
MKIAFMFSGQGSQYLGMGKEFYEKYDYVKGIFNTASKVLNYDVTEVMFTDQKKLNNTRYTQPAIFVLYKSILAVLEENNITADYSIGLSLGEYGAYLHNNVFDFKTGLKILEKRGEYMDLASKNNPGLMSAILGMEAKTLEELANKVSGYVRIANYNTYGQLVISGESAAVEKLNELAKTKGAKRAILLNTSGAFHTKLMEEAAIKFRGYLNRINLVEPNKKLLVNVTGDYYKSNIKEVMVEQITNSVLFYQMIEKLIADGVDTFIEIGPKTSLCSFVKKIDRSLNIMNVEDIQSLNKTLSKIGG